MSLPPHTTVPGWAAVCRGLSEDAVWSRFRDHADPFALRFVLERLGDRLFHQCRAVVGDDGLAEDAVQEAFVRLMAERHKLPTFGQMAAWMYRTSANAARQIARTRRRAAFREQAFAAQTAGETAAADADPARAELAAAVAQAVSGLPENERRAVELVYFERLSHADAAAALGWSRGSVGVYVGRALRRLQGLLSRRGVAVAAVAVLETALAAAPPPGRIDLDRVFAAIQRAVGAPAAVGWGAMFTTRRLAWAAVAGVGLAAAAGVGLALSHHPPPAAVKPAAAEESLQVRNLRLFHADVLPDLLAELKRMLPPDNPPVLVDARADGAAVECEFATTKPLLPATNPTGLRLRYCTVRRALDVDADLHGSGAWKRIDPKRPIILDLAIPKLPIPAVDLGHGGIAFGQKAFGKLPADERAEAELVRRVFGEPGDELVIPSGVMGVTTAGERLLVAYDSGLFARTGGVWRYHGECPGWSLTAAGDHLYADGHTAGEGLWRRPAAGVGTAWEKVCDRPPEDWRAFRVAGMTVAGGRVHYTVHRESDGATALWAKPVDAPAAAWVRGELPVSPILLTGGGDWLYSGTGGRVCRRPAAAPVAPWELIGRLPADAGVLQLVGDRLLAFDRSKGAIRSRPLAGSEVEWQVIGHVRSPSVR